MGYSTVGGFQALYISNANGNVYTWNDIFMFSLKNLVWQGSGAYRWNKTGYESVISEPRWYVH